MQGKPGFGGRRTAEMSAKSDSPEHAERGVNSEGATLLPLYIFSV
ncbi:hypothetical protein BN439_3902 [Erwinia amylovora Ea644]|nr:hypothetical protein BN439_3902 [Erwinia amylovora Ea644]CCP09006.1 hypothetical protein BN440_4023 [Erwinia amylovora MR1]